MNEALHPDLARHLAIAGHELRREQLPLTLLPSIHRSLAGRRTQRRIVQRLSAWFGWSSLAVACSAFALWIAVNTAPEDAAQTLAASGFVTVASEDTWREVERNGAGRVWLLSTEIPQSRLAALGLPYDPARAGERVPAQLLMHGATDVLAVRVIR